MELSLRSRLRAGDQSAFGELFDDHAQAVYGYAVRTLGDWAAAEDAVSLTFLEAWRLRAALHEDGESVRPWLFGIATNVLRNTARAARRHRAALARLPARDVVPDFADELVGRLDDSARLAAARRALARLRRGEREVFHLCVWVGLDYVSAAQALGVPVGTVRSRLSRARTRLRSLAAEELMEPGPGAGQVGDDRIEAVRSNQGKNR
ncbi:RNA polymerase sigma-70 factor (ECF subfamily) [Kitasatospora gansuensis]|uniref:RNA polymerase sigma-70 factor (ECF subfamily) n=1 Tax=Kitasatospora gansuensis TaxID=258050 RepID=A0A7W7WJC5_9ACTN|nr:RNA polymerase sigma factor [Kitasatospora gansuensis]MBB4949003.1 RNA polymerase sigma-70 factor (ECF subfamily) [Kitasatospora gansuensis]